MLIRSITCSIFFVNGMKDLDGVCVALFSTEIVSN
jgi:hypothetical protein